MYVCECLHGKKPDEIRDDDREKKKKATQLYYYVAKHRIHSYLILYTFVGAARQQISFAPFLFYPLLVFNDTHSYSWFFNASLSLSLFLSLFAELCVFGLLVRLITHSHIYVSFNIFWVEFFFRCSLLFLMLSFHFSMGCSRVFSMEGFSCCRCCSRFTNKRSRILCSNNNNSSSKTHSHSHTYINFIHVHPTKQLIFNILRSIKTVYNFILMWMHVTCVPVSCSPQFIHSFDFVCLFVRSFIRSLVQRSVKSIAVWARF